MKYLLNLFIFLGLIFSFEKVTGQISGPMLGYKTHTEVAIWLQTQPDDKAELRYFQTDSSFSGKTFSTADKFGIHHFTLGYLSPGKTYRYEILVNKKRILKNDTLQFTTQSLWQWRKDPPDFSILTGSCTYVNQPEVDRPGNAYGKSDEIFNVMAREKAEAMVWLGDNVYLREVDWDSPSGIDHRYRHMRKTKNLQHFLRKMHHYAIWDDHDFGPNDSNGSWRNKQLSSDFFKRYWMNCPQYQFNDGSIAYSFTLYDIDFFMLDNRFYRNSQLLKDSSQRQILGKEQIDWLINALRFSRSKFKMVAVGGQVLNTAAVHENHANFPVERQYLLDAIVREGIKGVVFLTGDRHHSEVSKFSKNGIEIHDFTVSPLTSSPAKNPENSNELRISGSLLTQNNYARISFSGKIKNRKLKIEYLNDKSEILYTYEISNDN